MKKAKENEAQNQIMAILLKLNAIEARNVIDSICHSLAPKAMCPPKRRGQPSKVELDRELFEFIMSLDLEFMTQKAVLAACINKFGQKRSPSRTALNRAFNNNVFDKKGAKS